MSSQELPCQDGHGQLYRLTATGDGVPAESRYFVSATEAQRWRERLRAAGYTAGVVWVPAEAFADVPDEELDRRAAQETQG